MSEDDRPFEDDPNSVPEEQAEEPQRVPCPNCCRLARVTSRRMGLLFYRCDLCEAVGAIPASG
jgi:ribosomal protein L37AE/L43A